MSRIENKFQELKSKKEKALIIFITAGDPDLKATKSLVLTLESGGADIIELGIPFSDPIADGPTIQVSSQRALTAGTNLEKVFQLLKDLRPKVQIPIVLMSYYNPIYQYGLKEFAREASSVGVDGIIISDLPPEEGKEWKECAENHGIETIFLVAPTSPARRVKLVAEYSTGFVYCISRTAVTGARGDLPVGLKELVKRIKEQTDKPIAVGFGISKPAQVAKVSQFADGVVVGSAMVQIIGDNLGQEELVPKVINFTRELKEATKVNLV